MDPVPFYEAPQEYDPAIPIDSVSEHPRNYNQAAEDKLAQLLDAHGFYGAIVVQKSTGLIIVGNNRHRQAKAKGAVSIPGFWLDVDDDEAEEILASDNLSSKLAVFDEAKLIDLLTRRQESPRGLNGSGYDEKSLAMLVRHQASLQVKAGDPNDEWDGMPDYDQPGNPPAYSVMMHFPTDDDASRFFELIERDRPKTKYLWWPHGDGFKGLDYSQAEVIDGDGTGS